MYIDNRKSKTVIEYESPDGQWFTLTGPNAGDRGVILTSDIENFYDVGMESIWNETAFGRGARFGGHRVPARRMKFSVDISDYNGLDWETNDSEWGKAWAIDRPGKLWVTKRRSRRWLTAQLEKELLTKFLDDPEQTQGEGCIVSTISGDPYWYSDPLRYKWTSPTSTLALDATTETGYKQNTDLLRRVRNNSCIETWPVWQIIAPGIPTVPDWSFGDNRENRAVEDAHRNVELAELVAGEHLRIDTDRAAWGGMYNTASKTPYSYRMRMIQFCYPFPKGMGPIDLPVSFSKAPAGVSIELIVPQPWPRPWGGQS
ncbi:hypothetical protein CH289_15925 [Rhodococcus sp. RS1C4]|nr:hypothetical protein [Rhodococcus sp. RS1C4]OZC50513.1 hypothetical protein CH289_15925 [Rhodococcus sp. RS1C4]